MVEAGYSSKVDGAILNAGLGRDISVNELAALIEPDPAKIVHVPHIHPQSEIMKLLSDSRKAKELLGWEAAVSLESGLALTREWIEQHQDLV